MCTPPTEPSPAALSTLCLSLSHVSDEISVLHVSCRCTALSIKSINSTGTALCAHNPTHIMHPGRPESARYRRHPLPLSVRTTATEPRTSPQEQTTISTSHASQRGQQIMHPTRTQRGGAEATIPCDGGGAHVHRKPRRNTTHTQARSQVHAIHLVVGTTGIRTHHHDGSMLRCKSVLRRSTTFSQRSNGIPDENSRNRRSQEWL